MTTQRSSGTREARVDVRPYLAEFKSLNHELCLFMGTVSDWFATHPDLTIGNPPVIHSVKSRLKNERHLAEKIRRKYVENGAVRFAAADLGSVVTDLTGVRVIHLHQKQLATIHQLLLQKVKGGDWTFAEEPKAFTWDPESAAYFSSLGLTPEVRETFYTSVHYVVKPKSESPLVCEIQVRTLFEEIWGEVDHALNYPKKATVRSRQEQLRVLSKLVGAGSRLLDSIFVS